MFLCIGNVLVTFDFAWQNSLIFQNFARGPLNSRILGTLGPGPVGPSVNAALFLGRGYEINNLICLFHRNQLCFCGYFDCHQVTNRTAILALNLVLGRG